jgi:hypothetical protein
MISEHVDPLQLFRFKTMDLCDQQLRNKPTRQLFRSMLTPHLMLNLNIFRSILTPLKLFETIGLI